MNDPRLPNNPPTGYLQALVTRLTDLFRGVNTRLDNIASGHLSGQLNYGTAAPTSGLWARGDRVWNSEPTESGAISSKYVVYGWICVTAGEPGTWKEMRCLTGN